MSIVLLIQVLYICHSFFSKTTLMMKKYLIIFLAASISASAYAQDNNNDVQSSDKSDKKKEVKANKTTSEASNKIVAVEPIEPIYIHKKPSIGFGMGLMTFYGDINTGAEIYEMSNFRMGYNVNLEQRFGKRFGASVNGTFGKLSQNERSLTSNLNFESSVLQGDANFVFHLDNREKGWRKTKVTSFISAGVGYMLFNPKGDFELEDGTKYYYWGDGSIRDQVFDVDNPQNGKIIHRDYEYETVLDSANSYSHGALVFPFTLGIKLKLSNKFETDLKATYTLTQSDNIDNVTGGGKDSYLFSSVSLRYNILAKTPKLPDNSPFAKTDFDKLVDNVDSDRDGVKDLDDKCGGTPHGARIDEKGCPIDDDNDGVPNYQDKEKNTAKDAKVDVNGVTVKDADLEKQYNDSVATPRDDLYKWRPSYRFDLDKEKAVDENKNKSSKNNNSNEKMYITESVPTEYQYADTNKDGVITSKELNTVVDTFFDGNTGKTADELNKMLKYFSDQK